MSVEGLVYTGEDDRGVSSELAGRVDGVAKPWAVGKTCIGEESGFRLAQGEIETCQVAGGRNLKVIGLLRGSGKARRGSLGR